MVSIKDVAREANVSTATVSRVINRQSNTSDKVTDAVHQAIKKLGYRVSTNKQSSQNVGVVVSDIAEPFFAQMLKGVETITRKNNRQMLVFSSDYHADGERQAIEQLINHCDLAVVHSKWLSDSELLDYTRQLPGMVLINRYIESIRHRCIAVDNAHGGYIATRHLLNKGHQYIGYLSSEQDIADSRDRLKGHQKALSEKKITIDDQYLVACYPSQEGGKEGAYNLLAKKLPLTAIVAYNDAMAAGVISVLIENGVKCPDEISVVGFDDLIVARYLTPSLSTIRYPIQVMAEQAARLAFSLADKKTTKKTTKKDDNLRSHWLIPTFVERSSTQSAGTIS